MFFCLWCMLVDVTICRVSDDMYHAIVYTTLTEWFHPELAACEEYFLEDPDLSVKVLSFVRTLSCIIAVVN